MRKLIRNRRASVLVLISLSATTLIALAGLAIDVGLAYRQHSAMQVACDAAALAGVVQPPPSQTPGQDLMLQEARRFAQLNGFSDGVSGVAVTGQIPPGSPNDYEVVITSQFAPLFTALVGVRMFTMSVGATARAFSQMPVDINGGGLPGQSNNVTTLSAFGPYAMFSFGDAYGTMFLDSGRVNPAYNPNGYDFQVTVPANYRTVFNTNHLVVQIFDPDTGDNAGGATNGTDEIRDLNPNIPANQIPADYDRLTKTRYTLTTVPNGFRDLTTQTQVATATYGQDSTTSDKWITPSGFDINLDNYPGVTQFRLNVKTLNGASENGYLLRAGPPAMATTADWSTANSNFNTAAKQDALNMIKSSGYLPLNFNTSSTQTASIGLGQLPPANGTPYSVHILKFDTDVGAVSVGYRDTNGNTWPGALAANGQFKTDTFSLPGTYPGGKLTADYRAGGTDTSSWSMTYDGSSPGLPSTVKLIK